MPAGMRVMKGVLGEEEEAEGVDCDVDVAGGPGG